MRKPRSRYSNLRALSARELARATAGYTDDGITLSVAYTDDGVTLSVAYTDDGVTLGARGSDLHRRE
jgi:hypothetical protein